MPSLPNFKNAHGMQPPTDKQTAKQKDKLFIESDWQVLGTHKAQSVTQRLVLMLNDIPKFHTFSYFPLILNYHPHKNSSQCD